MIIKSITKAESEEGRGTEKDPDISLLCTPGHLGREVILSLVLPGSVGE